MSDQSEYSSKPKRYRREYDPNLASDNFALALEEKLAQTIYERSQIDTRMMEDLRQYKGRYDTAVEGNLAQRTNKSKVFVNLTRPKTNAAEAQMVDLLFPNTSDKNWGIAPTPVPELAQAIEDDTPAVVGGRSYQDGEGNVIKNSDLALRRKEIAKEAAEAMQELIHDQLVEAKYNAKARDVIHDGCVFGTGVLKGATVTGKMNRVYRERSQETGGGFVALMETVFVPSVEVVRPWDFYPDMSASAVSEAEFIFERRYMTRQQVRNLERRKGYPAEQIRKILDMKAQETQHSASSVDDIRRLSGLKDSIHDTRYEVWEYHGPIPESVLIEFGFKDEADAMTETSGVVVYCGGVVLSVKLHLIDFAVSHIYQVWNWEPDDTCIFGEGVPRLMRDQQKIMNASWRATLDNAAVTSGPQLGIHRRHIKPSNGDWEITPFKLWEVSSGNIKDAIQSVEFGNHQQELLNIYQVARQMVDEVTGIPMLQQGEQGQSTQVLGGMSLLLQAANTVRRSQVKQWDDGITTPLITSFYDFNMQHSDNQDVKGDFQVDARGTSALLVRESLANAIMNLMNMGSASPMWMQIIAPKAREVLHQWAKTQQLPESLIPTEQELQAYQQQQAQQQEPEKPPAQIAAEAQLQVEQIRQQGQQAKQAAQREDAQMQMHFEAQAKQAELQLKQQLAQMEYQRSVLAQQTELYKLASQEKISGEQLAVKLKELEAKLGTEMQKFNTELDLKFTQPATPNANDGLE